MGGRIGQWCRSMCGCVHCWWLGGSCGCGSYNRTQWMDVAILNGVLWVLNFLLVLVRFGVLYLQSDEIGHLYLRAYNILLRHNELHSVLALAAICVLLTSCFFIKHDGVLFLKPLGDGIGSCPAANATLGR